MQALTVFLCTSSPAQWAYMTCMAFLLLDCIRRKPLLENLLRVLAIRDAGYNSLCFSASGSDYNAGLLAPLCDSTLFRAQSPLQPTPPSLPFSSFVVSCRIMHDYNQHVRLLSPEPWLVSTTKVYSGL